MEVNPQFWNDLDMDWTNPDPRDVKYARAITNALLERVNVSNLVMSTGFSFRELILLCQEGTLFQRSFFSNVSTIIRALVDGNSLFFLDMDAAQNVNEESIPSISWQDLNSDENTRICIVPAFGTPVSDPECSAFLRHAKNAIDKLTVCRADVRADLYKGWGSSIEEQKIYSLDRYSTSFIVHASVNDFTYYIDKLQVTGIKQSRNDFPSFKLLYSYYGESNIPDPILENFSNPPFERGFHIVDCGLLQDGDTFEINTEENIGGIQRVHGMSEYWFYIGKKSSPLTFFCDYRVPNGFRFQPPIPTQE